RITLSVDHAGDVLSIKNCLHSGNSVNAYGISIVEKPVQKYSVVFTINKENGKSIDHYDYSLVRFVVQRLDSPYLGWSYEWTTTRHPHSRYSHIGRNDPCPCESGKKYKKCCLHEEGVLRPHFQVTFDVTPPSGMSMFEYCD
ncbi:MAG: SEC-C domain-containing protein, partial [Deltaproteobacteria bacterium]|nr:SEC-C domain-containing protein [Deltaproteobacteria bacterium]